MMRKLAPLRKFGLAWITMQHSKFEYFFIDEFSETWLRHNTPVTRRHNALHNNAQPSPILKLSNNNNTSTQWIQPL